MRLTRSYFAFVVALMFGALVSVASAGPIAEFDAAFRQTYADYRTALAITNTPNRDKSETAVAAFQTKWAALVAKYRNSPPPQFAEDAQWGETLDAVTAIVARANADVAKGDVPAAHLTLEAVRERFGDLRARNGVVAYSDRIDAFHHLMEQVVSKPYGGFAGAGLTELVEDVAVLSYLGDELKKLPPPDAVKAVDFAPTLAALLDAVHALRAAARSGEAETIKGARSKVKPAFGKLFVKFG